MSKTYKPKQKIKSSWISRQWYSWLEVVTIRSLIPLALLYLGRNIFKFFKERNVIKKTLLSSQELVDELDDNGFYIDTINFYLFKFRTYALDTIQILTEQITASENMLPETMTRILMQNINEMLSLRGKKILAHTSMRILQPSDKVVLIRLHPRSMKAMIISFKDFMYSLLFSGIFVGIYFLLKIFVF